MNLSEKQRRVVESTEKYMCVIAGAGSGKTRTLTERIKRLISENKRGERVLAITFSNKAAAELKERLLQSYSQAELNELVFVGTIHNFCMEIVSQRASAIELPSDLHIFESFSDRFEIFKMALANIPQLKSKCSRANGELDEKKIRDIFDKFSSAKRNLKFPSDYHEHPLTQRLYQDYNDLMLSQNAIDFDDILLYAYKIIVEQPTIARIYHRIYKHICVDEAQDLNRAQYSVIKSIAGEEASLLMVGDPNQSIYGFNGSSPKYMQESFFSDFSVKQYELDENYRSSQKVIKAAQKIEPTFEMKGILPIVGEVDIQSFQNEKDEAVWIAEKIDLLLTHGHHDIEEIKCTPEQCAVLARNRYTFNVLEDVFKESGVEYNLRVSANKEMLSESLFFRVFDLGLRLIMNSRDVLHFEEMKSILGLQVVECESFEELRNSQEFKDAFEENGSEVLNSAWDSLQMSNQNFKFDKTLEILCTYCKPETCGLSENELALLYNDYLAWKERWDFYVKKSSIENRGLASMMREIALGTTNVSQESGITLSTVHMSKGLEFDVVFILGLNEGVFPDYRSLDDATQLAEEQHNMFVAITRAKRLCYMSYPEQRNMPWGSPKLQKPSRYVEQLLPLLDER